MPRRSSTWMPSNTTKPESSALLSQTTSIRRSGSYKRFRTFGHRAACTETPLPRVTYPTIFSPRIGLQHLARNTYLAGEAYSIADIAIAPWLRALDFYEAKDMVRFGALKNVPAYVERFTSRPAVKVGLETPAED